MKERPILFSAPMVKALLNGTKTQTRRSIKWPKEYQVDNSAMARIAASNDPFTLRRCPYGQPGDRLWVRETFCWSGYASDPEEVLYRADEEYSLEDRGDLPWKPSIFMPRWASRITLDITSVRVERLQDISEENAEAEGVEPNCALIDHSSCRHDEWINYLSHDEDFPCTRARDSFASLWQLINGKEGWLENPWVWVIEFKRTPQETP